MAIDSLDRYRELGLATVDTTPTGPKKKELGQDAFLKLMTTQLTHQDPTKPMENGDFLAQMAQFSTVSGIQDLQKSFSDFSESISSSQALQAGALVGRYVSAPSSEGLLAAGGEIKGSFELDSSSPSVNLKIIDPQTGETVRAFDLGGQAGGTVPFVWDGTLNDGTYADPGVYKIKVEGIVEGKNTAIATQIESKVESVAFEKSGGISLNLAGLDSIKFNQVKKIL